MHNEALRYRQFGTPLDVLALEASPLGALGAGRARVAMLAAPVNPSDLIPVTGAYRHRIQPPQVAGYEGVGIVLQAGDDAVPRSLVGKRVLPLRGPGIWQRFVDCDPAWMIPVPDDIGTDIAARAYINPLAAMLMLDAYAVAGRSVLITAAGSSCARLLGTWALRQGARNVTGIYRSLRSQPTPMPPAIGAISDSEPDDVREAARGADIVFDAVGGRLADDILSALAPGAVFVSYGLLSGVPPTPRDRRPQPRRFHLRDHLIGMTPEMWHSCFERVWALLRITPLPEVMRIALPDWRDALALFDRQGRIAKPLLDFQP